MAKYRGKYPQNIKEISGERKNGVSIVRCVTNEGKSYYFSPVYLDYNYPKLGESIEKYTSNNQCPVFY